MLRKTMVLCLVCFMGLLQPYPAGAKETDLVEIFDPKQHKVIKEVKLKPEVQKMVTNWLATADEVYAKLNPIPEDGYVVRIPLEPTTALQNRWLYANISEVFIVIPKNESPLYVLVGDDGLCCYLFNGDLRALSEALDFKLDTR